MTDELSERTCTRCGRNPLNEVFLVGDERLCFDCKYHKQPAVPSNVDDPETWKGIERSYDAQPAPQTDAEELRSEQMSRFATAPTAAQEPNRFIPDMAHCARCKKADNLHSPDGVCPPQKPRARDEREWMRQAAQKIVFATDKVSESIGGPRFLFQEYIKEVLGIIADHAPDVTALVEAAERVLSVCGPEGGELECYCGSVMGDDGELDEKRMCAPCELRTAIAAVKKERS